MEDLVSMCERRCRKACNLRSAAEDSDEDCHSGSSGGRARRYRKRGSPKPAAGDAGAMDTDPSPVRLWDSEHSEGYRTAYEPPSESEETARPPTRANTAPEPALKHDAEGLERPARARTAPVPRHTGPETDAIGDTPMGDESRRREPRDALDQADSTLRATVSTCPSSWASTQRWGWTPSCVTLTAWTTPRTL